MIGAKCGLCEHLRFECVVAVWPSLFYSSYCTFLTFFQASRLARQHLSSAALITTIAQYQSQTSTHTLLFATLFSNPFFVHFQLVTSTTSSFHHICLNVVPLSRCLLFCSSGAQLLCQPCDRRMTSVASHCWQQSAEFEMHSA